MLNLESLVNQDKMTKIPSGFLQFRTTRERIKKEYQGDDRDQGVCGTEEVIHYVLQSCC